jgi:probable F420-dependent oxidoreductase
MKIGFGLPTGGAWATPEAIDAVARRAESRGYSSLWTFQRLLYALEPRNEYYGAPGGVWPEVFKRTLDPIVVLTLAAAATRAIRLGVSVLIVPFYEPIVLAKQLATLDYVSHGRLEVGLGIGWSLDEFEAVGAAASERGARADEFIRCLKTVWTQERVEFAGRYYRIPPCRVEPKPVQRPHPPILVGGYNDAVFRRAAEVGDGYTGGNIPLADMATAVKRVRTAAERAGRDPAAFPIVCRGAFNMTDAPLGPGRRPLWGSAAEIRDDVQRYAEAGVTELFLDPNFQPGGAVLDRVLVQMDTLAPAAGR